MNSKPEVQPSYVVRRGSISGGAAVLFVSRLVAAFLGMAISLILAGRFGASPAADAFFVATSLPFVFLQLARSAFERCFVPLFMQHQVSGRERESWAMANRLLFLTVLCTIAVAGLVFVFASPLIGILAPGLLPQGKHLSVELTRAVSPSFVLLGVAAMMEGVLLAQRRFPLLALASLLVNSGLIAGLLIPGIFPGVVGVGVGFDLGALLEVGILAWALRRTWPRGRSAARSPEPSIELSPFWTQLLPVLGWMGLAQVNQIVDRVFASTLGAGRIAVLAYATALVFFLPNILGGSILSAATSGLSEKAARREWKEFRRILTECVRMVLFLTLPVAAGMLLVATPLVRLLFERGHFDSSTVGWTAWATVCYTPSLAVSALAGVLMGTFFILRQGQKVFYVMLLTLGLNVILDAILIRFYDYAGIAIGTSIYSFVRLLILLYLLPREVMESWGKGVAWPMFKMGAAVLVMLGTTWGVGQLLGPFLRGSPPEFGPMVEIGLMVAVGVGTYVVAAWLLGLRELPKCGGLIRGRLGLG